MIDELVVKVGALDRDRAWIVYRYFRAMRSVLAEARRVVQVGRRRSLGRRPHVGWRDCEGRGRRAAERNRRPAARAQRPAAVRIRSIDEAGYEEAEKAGRDPVKVLIVIEEAHEFLSEERIAKMPNLFEQVTRIAKRGRKRWLGLVFVTQLPQHLPRQVLGLINNFVLHKINDTATIGRLRGSIAGIDEALWERLPGLAPGQAIVSFTSMARPLLIAVDPTPAKLRMID